MADSNNKQSSSMLSNTFGLAKKIGTTGLNLFNHVAPNSVSKLSQAPESDSVVEGKARTQSIFEKKQYDNPQQMMREHLPKVSSQLLGRHYKKINNVASFISPQLNDKMSDYFFEKLNDFVSDSSSVEKLLKEVGVKDIQELSQDSARSQRISQALANQNKVLAAIQGALTGATGVIGSAIDVPSSIALALRSIYQTGRAHGFELKPEDHEVVEFIFKTIDIGSVAEKQALLIALRTFANTLKTQDMSQFQQLLGSSNSTDVWKNWISNEDGTFKWAWLENFPQFNIISKLTPFACIGISATYSWKLVDDATEKAQIVFKGAQQYLIQHPQENISALAAFEKSEILLAQASPLLQAPEHEGAVSELSTATTAQPSENETIQDVQVLKKDEAHNLKNDEAEINIADLAKQHIATENETNGDEQTTESAGKKVEKVAEKSQVSEKSATKDTQVDKSDAVAENAVEQSEDNEIIQDVQVLKKDEAQNLKSDEPEISIADLAKQHIATENETIADEQTTKAADKVEKLAENSQVSEKNATKNTQADKTVATEKQAVKQLDDIETDTQKLEAKTKSKDEKKS
ncbi:EcsC family protein [Acinetobacter defluvii]|uniref:EcsC family protein n=1 Tax=Acinetobacter defluvii TaxID=1871111 RepID=UPI003AF574AE